jgi:hypothetical protein
VEDLLHGAAAGRVSQRFHYGLIEVFPRLAVILGDRTSLNSVCLSGGHSRTPM